MHTQPLPVAANCICVTLECMLQALVCCLLPHTTAKTTRPVLQVLVRMSSSSDNAGWLVFVLVSDQQNPPEQGMQQLAETMGSHDGCSCIAVRGLSAQQWAQPEWCLSVFTQPICLRCSVIAQPPNVIQNGRAVY